MSELKKKGKVRLTAVSIYHYVRLIGRSVIFLVLLYLYIMYRLQQLNSLWKKIALYMQERVKKLKL